MAWPNSARYQTFVSGTSITSGYLNAVQDAILGIHQGFTNTVVPAHIWQLLLEGIQGATGNVRFYSGKTGAGEIAFGVNASFDDAAQLWSSDDHATSSFLLKVTSSGITGWYKGATAGTWANGGWTTTATLTSTGAWVVLDQLSAGAGVSAATSVTAGTSISATTTVTAGTGITATTGNVNAASGTVNGNKGFSSDGTMMVGGDVSPLGGPAGWTSQNIGSNSNNTRGQLFLQGAAVGANPAINVAWKGAPLAVVPVVMVTQFDTTGTAVPLSWTADANKLTVTWRGTPSNGITYGFGWIAIS